MITGVKVEHVMPIWPRVEGYFQSFVDRSKGTVKASELLHGVLGGTRQMWIAIIDEKVRACALTEINNGTVVLNFCSGEGREDWAEDMVTEIKAWAASLGLTFMVVHRPGWKPLLKKMGFRMTHMVSELEAE